MLTFKLKNEKNFRNMFIPMIFYDIIQWTIFIFCSTYKLMKNTPKEKNQNRNEARWVLNLNNVFHSLWINKNRKFRDVERERENLTSEKKTSRSDSFRVCILFFLFYSISTTRSLKKVESRKYIIASSPPTQCSVAWFNNEKWIEVVQPSLVIQSTKFSANACNSLCRVCGVILDNLYFTMNRLSSRHNNKTALMINELIWERR